MAPNKPPVTWWSLLLGERSWSLLGGAAAVVAIGLVVVFLLVAGLVDGIWLIGLGVVLLLICIALAVYAFYNMAVESRLHHGMTPSEQEAEERFERNKQKRKGHQEAGRSSDRSDRDEGDTTPPPK